MKEFLKNISILEIALLAMIVKVLASTQSSFADAAVLFILTVPYIFKQIEAGVYQRQDDRFKDLQDQINTFFENIELVKQETNHSFKEMDANLESMKKVQAQVAKSADDIQKVISTKNLTNAIYTRTQRAKE